MNISKKLASLLPAATLVLTLAIPAAAANGKPAAAPSAKPAPTAPVPPEKHPQIHEALEALRSSKQQLEHAAHDFGGHRVEAIRAIDEAIHQLEICIQYDKD
jgi:Spy/CpxP family protein refolding chaperone